MRSIKVTLLPVQRLFTMFPAGLPGIGLLCLRVSLAAALLLSCPGPVPFLNQGWGYVALSLACGGLALGLLTPYLGCFLFVAVLTAMTNRPLAGAAWHVLATAAALVLLGPGAYSLDARIFGRKQVKIP